MGKKFHLSKRAGIGLFCTAALIIAVLTLLHTNPLADPQDEFYKKIIACLLIVAACVIFIRFYDKITSLPVELYENRQLIWRLARNDFKKRYAGSYLGMVWALAQPVVTVVMYWFVFDNFFGQKAQLVSYGIEMPYVLYLTAGLVPWFYFTEAWQNGTTALLEYNYLVKQVVFKISILPIIKIVAATFVHLFFVVVMLAVAAMYGVYPTIYTIQIIYFSACMFFFILGLSYATCALVIFFRDLTQIIAIFLQVGMWATPILWNITMLDDKPVLLRIIKLNPLVYIVNGYRSALVEQTWFFEDFYSTIYFWIVTVAIFGLGALIFKRLKPQFADVL
ncbi:MAG: ABC transporter permease [Lachnospiraceae bacterium]|nr:ABC transporter permease [Lachnospiraceae bacterium]